MVNNLLKEFRKEIHPEYLEKGILPPKKDSEAEMFIFKQWLKGKEKLKSNGARFSRFIGNS